MQDSLTRRALLATAVGLPICLHAEERGAVEAQRLRVRFSLGFVNPRETELAHQRIWCYLPASLLPAQQLAHVTARPSMALHRDHVGHNYASVEIATVPAHGRVYIAFDAQVQMANVGEPVAAPADWLTPERFIESDHPDIMALARGLRQLSEHATVEAIFDWVATEVSYAGYLADDRGALYALTERRGDCTEQADLVVALARACSIPARMAGGYVVERDTVLNAVDYHNWAEVGLDGNWHIVDANRRELFPSTCRYLRFRLYRDVPTNPLGFAHRHAVEGALQAIES
ncbi:transglutaminase-like domain-containing protein [Roseateles cellulosilyticus]|uniref:Transglutaminase domain-containing protein n=1 Tax=Pelomonas cellulosilytica TaxID=2906762 RepID=A0ABS8XUA1_9BURK|nr:transglutaminase domain-containing protein [Pelomonas sp. P8]MCE4554279.1 transglutaminase domain-containing protein [Pelomonas sp. P8]